MCFLTTPLPLPSPSPSQALFRPMAMMIPDYALVAEVMLFSEGFEDSKTLSRKMVKLYKLSSEQLSQQVGGRCGREVWGGWSSCTSCLRSSSRSRCGREGGRSGRMRRHPNIEGSATARSQGCPD